MTSPATLVRQVTLRRREGRHDVVVRDGRVRAIDAGPGPGVDLVLDGDGATLLPGLHDHHCHLLATAAAAESVPCGPPEVTDRAGLADRLAAAGHREGWIRGVGYVESVAGELDRASLDELTPDVPVRVSHRSGALWMLNSAALRALDLDGTPETPAGVERDAAGRATGRLWRLDSWLRDRLGPTAAPDLAALSARLAALGVTGVTDATPDLEPGTVEHLERGMVQRVHALGGDDPALPRKIVVADHELPDFERLRTRLVRVRPRAVAVHCVTREALLLTLAVLRDIGPTSGDRIEHAAVVPREAVGALVELDVAVVTQPSLVARRGDDYLAGVHPDDREVLWPFASLSDAGVAVACSSDAPYGDLDPWASMAAAADRRSPSGSEVAPHERVPVAVALDAYLGPAHRPGRAVRRVRVGAPADLVLLDRHLDDLLEQPTSAAVRATLIGGVLVHGD